VSGVLVIALVIGMLAGCSSTTGAAPGGPSWTPPTLVPGSVGIALYGISCPSTTWCAAASVDGTVVIDKGGTWSAPVPVPVGGSLDAISCATTTFCVAIGGGGHASVYRGAGWSASQTIGPEGTYEVSCPTTTFCAAVGVGGLPTSGSTLVTFDGSSWTNVGLLGRGKLHNRLLDVSCSSPLFCVAVGDFGQTYVLRDGTWSVTGGPPGLWAVSCPSSSFCMGLTPSATATFRSGRWSATSAVTGLETDLPRSVSCPTTSSCTVLGLGGEAASWSAGTGWSSPTLVFPGGAVATADVSCSTPGRCVAVNAKGETSRSEAHATR